METPPPKSKEPPKEDKSGAPAPEVLQPKAEGEGTTSQKSGGERVAAAIKARKRSRGGHKATFIGLAIVIALLAINGAVVVFVIKKQQKSNAAKNLGEVNLNKGLLDQLGVSDNLIGASGTQLVVTPAAKFNDKVAVGGDLTINGNATINKELRLTSKFTANEASVTQLQAGETSLTQLNVNGDSTITNLALRSNLQVAGTTRLQGTVTVDKLMTINNSLNVAGNLTIGGTLSAGGFSARALTSTSTLTIGGHILTGGPVPGVGPGGAVGPAGTVSMSGNDSAGTIAINTGGAPSAGILANVAFKVPYGSVPHVVITPVGAPTGLLQFYITRTVGGFSIGTNNAPAPGTGYLFDYHVMQ